MAQRPAHDARERSGRAEAPAQARRSARDGLPPAGGLRIERWRGRGPGLHGVEGGSARRRVLPDGTTVAVVLATNWSTAPTGRFRGRVVGRELRCAGWWAGPPEPAGSCIGRLTDAPPGRGDAARGGTGRPQVGSVRLGRPPRQWRDLCRLATGCGRPRPDPRSRCAAGFASDDLFEATVDATESAVWGQPCRRPPPPGGGPHRASAAAGPGSPRCLPRADQFSARRCPSASRQPRAHPHGTDRQILAAAILSHRLAPHRRAVRGNGVGGTRTGWSGPVVHR